MEKGFVQNHVLKNMKIKIIFPVPRTVVVVAVISSKTKI
jgi:hypothetical protein